ncbi:hypothetical protein [Silvimonas amylolytica]|uniref:Uncharacterized protein n=1 Tax=Silvimonas amylolytica TaxID=449663 RepID=A0ABQ2PIH3_9NEIS|nr:hypothetical protein [Silvimonas amylolytica]GGP25277.1 hypothetical protein GCM10010971_10960 [Silvimonas amylolytica]
MLTNQDARDLMYRCYIGYWSALYYAAGTGIVQSFDHLREECSQFTQPALSEWIDYQAQHAPPRKSVFGGTYWLLPWAKALTRATPDKRDH